MSSIFACKTLASPLRASRSGLDLVLLELLGDGVGAVGEVRERVGHGRHVVGLRPTPDARIL